MTSPRGFLPFRSGGAAPSIAIVLVAMSSLQLGASFAKQLFPLVGPQGASALRLTIAAAILWTLARPWRSRPDRKAARALLVYGLALAGLNLFFYVAIGRIPLGIAVAIDFTGPLLVVVLHSRRRADFLWVVLAALGIALLLPIGAGSTSLDPVGVLFCFAAAVCWGLYIIFGQKAGASMPSGRATAYGVAIATVVVVPFGVAEAGWSLFSVAVLPLGIAVAVLSSALPNSLEMVAMKRLPTRVFGVLMSLEPALGALCGWLILGERLTIRQDIAILCVILASAGATLSAEPASPPLADG